MLHLEATARMLDWAVKKSGIGSLMVDVSALAFLLHAQPDLELGL